MALEKINTFVDGDKDKSTAKMFNDNFDQLYKYINDHLIVGELDPENNVSATVPCLYLNETNGKVYKKTENGSTDDTTGWIELAESTGIVTVLSGIGSPEGVVEGNIGYMYQDIDPNGNGDIYIKKDNGSTDLSTGWEIILYPDQDVNTDSDVEFDSVSVGTLTINGQTHVTITGSCDGNTALKNLLIALDNTGLIDDQTTLN
jgi:hypothetical protein